VCVFLFFYYFSSNEIFFAVTRLLEESSYNSFEQVNLRGHNP